MAERNFSLLNESEPKGLQPTYPGQGNDSAGFMFPYKVASGTMRGTQNVGDGGVKIDSAHNRIEVGANNVKVLLGDSSDQDNTTGFSFIDSTNTRRILIGTFPDGSVKAKLSQPGYDVATATDDQLIWSSDFNSFKIVETGSTSIQGSSSSVSFASVAFTRTYTKPPIVTAYAVVNDTGVATEPKLLPYVKYVADGGAVPPMYGVYYILDVGATTTEVLFTLDNSFNGSGSSVSATIKYYVMQETSAV